MRAAPKGRSSTVMHEFFRTSKTQILFYGDACGRELRPQDANARRLEWYFYSPLATAYPLSTQSAPKLLAMYKTLTFVNPIRCRVS